MAELLVARRNAQEEKLPIQGSTGSNVDSGSSANTAPSPQPVTDLLSSLDMSSNSSTDRGAVRKQIVDEAGKADKPDEKASDFDGKLRPDKVQREVGPSVFAALAAGAYRLAGTPYQIPGGKTLGVDMGKNAVPRSLTGEPQVKLGDNSGQVFVTFPLKDDKVFVDEARIVASDGQTILDKAKSTGGKPGEFRFGGADSQYPEGAFLVYKMSNGKSFHMPLRSEASAA